MHLPKRSYLKDLLLAVIRVPALDTWKLNWVMDNICFLQTKPFTLSFKFSERAKYNVAHSSVLLPISQPRPAMSLAPA